MKSVAFKAPSIPSFNASSTSIKPKIPFSYKPQFSCKRFYVSETKSNNNSSSEGEKPHFAFNDPGENYLLLLAEIISIINKNPCRSRPAKYKTTRTRTKLKKKKIKILQTIGMREASKGPSSWPMWSKK